jgi:hypothetical protein
MTYIFLFLSPRLFFAFPKDSNFIFEIFFRIISKACHLKPWFEFEYSNQFSKVPYLKNLKKFL